MKRWRPFICGLAVGVSVVAMVAALLDTSYSDNGVSRVVTIPLLLPFDDLYVMVGVGLILVVAGMIVVDGGE